ncbi:Lipoprotein [Yersinia thracica]|uniref:Lipoprotein n=1 Tax=Yersinia thracica TaxID=2890319 RepID=A0A0T9PF61_9GAMM|nr:type II secretion system pilot lipoprotein GspS [Yersinia thracica]CNH62217.1 Lipoprotein [Yersinia thracica]
MKTKKHKVILLMIPIIFGCESHNKKNSFNGNVIEKITALTSGIRFLKEICVRENLPNENEIVNVAIKMLGKDKVVNTREFETKIATLTNIRYEEIKSHKTDDKKKCHELENILKHFIKIVNS